MNYNDKSFYINSIIVISVITLFLVILNHFFLVHINSLFIKIIISLALSLALYLFFAHTLIENYKQSQKRVKNLIDETLHELNTPIATIEANVQLLRKRIKDPKDLKRLERIYQASNNLLKLYNENEALLKSEIDLFEKEEFFIDELINDSIKNFQEMIEKKGLSLEVDIEKKRLYTNRFQFRKAVENLISNAIKYNKTGGKIEIKFQDNLLKFIDSGIGIDTKNLFLIFEKSYQENPSTKGFGLGLTIVKRYCDKEQIDIKIETRKDKGTSIILDLSKILLS